LLLIITADGRGLALVPGTAICQQLRAAFAPQAAGQAAAPVVEMSEGAPPVAAHIFAACTQLDPSLRPNAQQVVEWLRGSD
jgi:hypothetical protein